MEIRPATPSDIPTLGRIASEALRMNPITASFNPRGIPKNHAEHLAQIISLQFQDPRCSWQVAVDKATGSVVGFIAYQRFSNPDLEPAGGIGAPGMSYPEGTDVKCIQSWTKAMDDWKAEVLAKEGTHYRGRYLCIDPTVHKMGIGSKLCKVFADEVEKEGLPVYLGSTYYTTPFFERFAYLNGYTLKSVALRKLETEDPKRPLTMLHFLKLEKITRRHGTDGKI